MPGIRATSSALAVVACAAVLYACGGNNGEGPIPPGDGEALLAQLNQIEGLVNESSCDEARAVAAEFAAQVDGLPSAVDGELRDALVDASDNLESLTADRDQCTPPDTGVSGQTGTVPTTSSTTTSTETTTTDTTTDEPPSDDGNGDGPPDEPPGGGNGNPGGGNDGGDDSGGGIGSDG